VNKEEASQVPLGGVSSEHFNCTLAGWERIIIKERSETERGVKSSTK